MRLHVCALIGKREKYEMNLCIDDLSKQSGQRDIILYLLHKKSQDPETINQSVQCNGQMMLRLLNTVDTGSQWQHLFSCSTAASSLLWMVANDSAGLGSYRHPVDSGGF